jgi:multicomponent Na+:H+ antiporter subunit G
MVHILNNILLILTWFCIISGCVFILIGAIGIHRMPDVFTRLHAASLTDTLGAGLLLLGLGIHEGFTLATAKLFFILAFLFFTSPTSTHALAKAALHGGVKPVCKDERNQS